MLLGACVLMVALVTTLIVNARETARAEPLAVAAERRRRWDRREGSSWCGKIDICSGSRS